MKKVILINPTALFVWLRYVARPVAPHGILSVGTALHHAGYEVTLIDQKVQPEWKEELSAVLDHDVSFVGISSMTSDQITNGLKMAEFVRTLYDGPIVWGGVHPTLLPEQTLEHPLVDFVVRGEGEETAVDLARAFDSGTSVQHVGGISYTCDGRTIHNEERPFLNLDTVAVPNYDLLDMNKQLIDYKGYRMMNFGTSRGCPFRCAYCYAQKFHHRTWRPQSVQKVTEQLVLLRERYGVNRICFDEDNFFTDQSRAGEILEILKEMKVSWSASARIDRVAHMDDNFLKLIEQSGCKQLILGAESGNDRVLELIRKGITRQATVECNRRLARFSFPVRFQLMIGLPTETYQEMTETVDLAVQLKRENKNAMVSAFAIFTPFPGTPMHDMAVKSGFMAPASLEQWARLQFTADNAVWLSAQIRMKMKIVAFASPFLNDSHESNPPLLLRILGLLYRPLARFRMKHRFFAAPVEFYGLKATNAMLGLFRM